MELSTHFPPFIFNVHWLIRREVKRKEKSHYLALILILSILQFKQHERRLCRDLQKRVKQFYEYYLSRKSAFNEDIILAELSSSLRRQVVLFLNRDIITKIPFFNGEDENFVSHVVSVLRPEFCVPNDYVFKENDTGNEMYFLIKGRVSILKGNPETLIAYLDEV